MVKTARVMINGLKDLRDLEMGKTKDKARSNMQIIKADLHKLLLLEKGKYINHDDLQDHDDGDNKNISGNVSIINIFPNALLVENSILSKEEKNKNSDIPKKKINKIYGEEELKNSKKEDIWEIIDQIKKENNSDALDLLTTDNELTTEKNITLYDGCKGCHSKGTLVEDIQSGIIVCSKCGIKNEEILDAGPEWRQYNNEDNQNEGVNRCGCPSNYYFPKSSQGTIMTGSNNNRLKRKQKWNSMVYKERSLNQVFKDMANICSKNNIPKNIVDTAEFLYKKLSDCKHKSGENEGKQVIIRGINRKSIIAACIFKSCDMNKNPRTVKEIAKCFGLQEKKVTKGIKHYEKIMKNSDDINGKFLDHFNPNTAEDYIRRHCPKLKISQDNTNLAVKISYNCSKMKLASDHNPQSIAAGSILAMVNYCYLSIDKKDIAKLFKTSDVTIGKIYNKIMPYVDALVNDDATEYLIKKFRING